MGREFSLQRGAGNRVGSAVLRDGDLFVDRYRIIRTAAFGGMSRIYEAADEHSGRPIALKVLSLPNVDPLYTQRFEREIRILRTLVHPNLVRAHDNGRTNEGMLYLALEWLTGQDLGHTVKAGVLTPRLSCEIVLGALRGLDAVHDSGVVHRDLKPANIFLQTDAVPPDGVKVLDFGVAKLVEDHMIGSYQRTLTSAGMVVGTPFYMAPEQAQGSGQIDHRADLFSLGAVLFECICGKRPFVASSALALLVRIASEDAPSICEYRPETEPAIDAFLQKALARDPAARFQTAVEMEAELRQVLQDIEIEAPTIFAKVPDSTTDPNHDTDETQAMLAYDANITIRTQGPFEAQDTLQPEHVEIDSHDQTVRQEVGDQPQMVTVLVADLSLLSDGSDGVWGLFEEEVAKEGGKPLPVRGGVAIGVFGAGVPAGDEPVRAVRAGLQALRLERRLEDQTRGGSIRAAVASGTIYDAEVGDTPDAVEAACSLLEYAEPTELVVDAATLQTTSALIEAKPRGEHVYVVTGAVATGAVVVPAGGRTASAPLVGRSAELEGLFGHLDRVSRSHDPHCVVITGDPGIGKSRLRHEFEVAMAGRGVEATVLLGHGDLATKSQPFSLFADALRRRGVVRGGEAQDILHDKLDRLIPGTVPAPLREQARRELAKLIGSPMLDEQSATTPRGPADSDFADRTLGVRLRGTVMDILRGYAKTRPLVLLLDDVQWSDSTSLGVVLDVIRADDFPALVVLCGRREIESDHAQFIDALEGTGRHSHVELPLLGSAAAKKMAAALLGGPVPEDLLAMLMRRTRGNPYYLEETVLALATERIDADVTETDLSLSHRLDSVPADVDSVVRSRLDGLSEGQRRLLEHAAIFGGTFWDQGLVALGCGQPKDDLNDLIERDFIEVRDTSRYAGAREYKFRSQIARDVAYELLGEPERRRLHQLAANYLEVAGEADSVTIARHLAPAGDNMRALRGLVDGAKRALVGGDATGARDIVAQGLQLAGADTTNRERIGLLEVQQESLELLGHYADALRSVDSMASLDQSEANRWRNASRRGALMLAKGESSGSLRCMREAMEIEERRGAGLPAAWLAIGLGDALQERGDTFSACAQYQRAYGAGKTYDSAYLVARGVLRLGRIAYATSDLGQAVRLFDDARRRFDEDLGDRRQEAHSWLALGAVAILSGDSGVALEQIDRAQSIYETIPDHLGQLMSRAYRAMAYFELGRSVECEAEIRSTTELCRDSETRHPKLLCGLVSLRALVSEGRHGEAADFARHLFESAVRTLPRFVVPIESALGVALARAGDPATGVRHAEAAVARLESQKASEDEDPQRIYVNYAEALEIAGDHGRAQHVWHQAATTMVEVESRLSERLRTKFRQRTINHHILRRTGTPQPPMHQL